MKRTHSFQIIVEQDESGLYVAECPAFQACYTQARTYEKVMERIRDVISLCLDEYTAKGKQVPSQPEIIGVRRVEVTH